MSWDWMIDDFDCTMVAHCVKPRGSQGLPCGAKIGSKERQILPCATKIGSRSSGVRLGRRPRLRKSGQPEMDNGFGERKLVYMDGINWLGSFWNTREIMTNPWRALRNSDKKVRQFVHAARLSNFEIVLVADADTKTEQALGKWHKRRQEEIFKERKKVCLGVDIFLVESFQKHGIRVVRPLGADADDVLAALAIATSGIVLSRDRDFFRYDRPICVCNGFSVRDGKLFLEPTTTIDTSAKPRSVTRRVQLELAHAVLSYEQNWSLGVITKYRPSLMNGMTRRGTSSSSDKTMGNLHVLARPLRAAVYAILGEEWAVEEVPEWCKENKKVVWTETTVAADPALVPVLNKPQAVVAWLVERDTLLETLEPWRAAERNFNICALAAEMIVVSSQGAWTMRKCMELFHRQVNTIPPRRHHNFERFRAPSSRALIRPGVGAQVFGNRARDQDFGKQVADVKRLVQRLNAPSQPQLQKSEAIVPSAQWLPLNTSCRGCKHQILPYQPHTSIMRRGFIIPLRI